MDRIRKKGICREQQMPWCLNLTIRAEGQRQLGVPVLPEGLSDWAASVWA